MFRPWSQIGPEGSSLHVLMTLGASGGIRDAEAWIEPSLTDCGDHETVLTGYGFPSDYEIGVWVCTKCWTIPEEDDQIDPDRALADSL